MNTNSDSWFDSSSEEEETTPLKESIQAPESYTPEQLQALAKYAGDLDKSFHNMEKEISGDKLSTEWPKHLNGFVLTMTSMNPVMAQLLRTTDPEGTLTTLTSYLNNYVGASTYWDTVFRKLVAENLKQMTQHSQAISPHLGTENFTGQDVAHIDGLLLCIHYIHQALQVIVEGKARGHGDQDGLVTFSENILTAVTSVLKTGPDHLYGILDSESMKLDHKITNMESVGPALWTQAHEISENCKLILSSLKYLYVLCDNLSHILLTAPLPEDSALSGALKYAVKPEALVNFHNTFDTLIATLEETTQGVLEDIKDVRENAKKLRLVPSHGQVGQAPHPETEHEAHPETVTRRKSDKHVSFEDEPEVRYFDSGARVGAAGATNEQSIPLPQRPAQESEDKEEGREDEERK